MEVSFWAASYLEKVYTVNHQSGSPNDFDLTLTSIMSGSYNNRFFSQKLVPMPSSSQNSNSYPSHKIFFLGFCVLLVLCSPFQNILNSYKRWEGDFRNTCSFDEVTQQYIDVVNMCNSLSTFLFHPINRDQT